MFKRIDHVEIIPSDMQRAIDFYTNVIGFQLKTRRKASVPPMDEIAFLQLNDTMLELLTFTNSAPRSTLPNPVGYRMMAIEVEDMDQTLAYLKEKGIEPSRAVMILGTSKRAEILDPDGLTIELRQW